MPLRAMHLVALSTIGILATGCGGGADTPDAASTASSITTTVPTRPAAGTALETESTPIGRIVVNGSGNTLYSFDGDRPGSSRCLGACATAWPPLTSDGKPSAGDGIDASKISLLKRPDGTDQVAYGGRPLYFFSGDGAPGEVKGRDVRGFGFVWRVLSPAGSPIDR